MEDFNSKYTGEQVEELLDMVANGEAGGGGGITEETYLADFTMFSLRQGMDNGDLVRCNMNSLIEAMTANKTILVREDEESDGYKGVYVFNGYAEDLLYFSIVDSQGDVLYCEGTNYTNTSSYIDGRTLYVRRWDDKQDALVSGENIKTINGESIVGEGDITIPGGSGTITEIKANGTSVATSGVADIPAATTSVYGVTKLTSSTSSTSTSLAATASAVKSAYDLANGRQEKLISGTNIKTINGTSILGSGNITIEGGGSGGVSGAYAEVNHGTSDTTFALTPNTFHVWDEVSSLTLTFGSEQSGVANEYLFQFTSGATATTLSLPDDIKWANDTAPTIAESKIYQISVLRGLATVLEFNTAQALIENLCVFTGGTLIFQYPVASDLVVNFGMDKVYVSQGESRVVIDFPLEPSANIRGITPASDNTYTYIY